MLPRFGQDFILETDASTSRIAWTLSQKDESNRPRVISYGTRSLRGAEIHYSVTQLECLSLIEAVKENHTYLANNFCEIRTHYISLTFLKSMKLSPNNRLARWALFLQPYNLKSSIRAEKRMCSRRS
jgi:hypothetical protein